MQYIYLKQKDYENKVKELDQEYGGGTTYRTGEGQDEGLISRGIVYILDKDAN
jgi:hypothetical protein